MPAPHLLSYLQCRSRAVRQSSGRFSAELALAQAQLNELLSLVQVYRALGGGWEQ